MCSLGIITKHRANVHLLFPDKTYPKFCLWGVHSSSPDFDVNPPEHCDSVLDVDGKLKKNVFDLINSDSVPDIAYERLEKADYTYKVLLALRAEYRQFYNVDPTSMFVNMEKDSHDKYCEHQTSFRKEHLPKMNCNNDLNDYNKTFAMPWCGNWRASAIIGKINCGIVENAQSHINTIWSIYSRFGIVSAKDKSNHLGPEFHLRSALSREGVVQLMPKVAVAGYGEYPGGSGHFLNEILPKLLFLDLFLPEDIPLYWPANDHALGFKSFFEKYGVLKKKRLFLPQKEKQLTTIVAKDLYFVSTDIRHGEPLCLWVLHRYMHQVFNKILMQEKKYQMKKIMILDRKASSRKLNNIKKLTNELMNQFPNLVVETIEFGGPLSIYDAGIRMQQVKVFIAPHGGGLNNMFLLQPGAVVVEIGYVGKKQFLWPTDYWCLSRNLGHKYYASLGLSGGQNSNFVVNIEEVVEIVRNEMKQQIHAL